MKKLLLWVFGFAIVVLFGQVFAIETYINNKAVYLNVYDLSKYYPNLKPEIKDWNWENYLYLNLDINNVYNFYKQTRPNSSDTSKLQSAIEIWTVWKMYIKDVIISKQKENNKELYIDKWGKADYNAFIWKISLPLQSIISKFNNWENYIHVCISNFLTSKDYNVPWVIPFKYTFCSTPIKVYYYNWKFFLDEAKYNEYKKSVDDEQAKSINSKLDFIKKKLDYYKISWWIQKVENYIKEYTDKNYKSTLSNIEKQRILFNLKNEIYKKFWFYKWKIIVPNILSKEDIYFVTDYYYNLYTKEIDNNYYSQVNQKEQYKTEALSNYWELQKRYNQLKQEYEQYKLKTAENRQRAIKLTIVLTKILSKYHNKETKLKVLDQIDQIIETKYWPDKFKNQDLIWYVKDYLKIIRLAIQLSE